MATVEGHSTHDHSRVRGWGARLAVLLHVAGPEANLTAAQRARQHLVRVGVGVGVRARVRVRVEAHQRAAEGARHEERVALPKARLQRVSSRRVTSRVWSTCPGFERCVACQPLELLMDQPEVMQRQGAAGDGWHGEQRCGHLVVVSEQPVARYGWGPWLGVGSGLGLGLGLGLRTRVRGRARASARLTRWATTTNYYSPVGRLERADAAAEVGRAVPGGRVAPG
eukprot:scaffold79119_cov46-Phaeocystis_antarctica.AAC.4